MLAILLAGSLPGCGNIGYYAQAIGGHLGVMRAVKPIDEVMRDPAAIAPTGLDPGAVTRLWKGFVEGAPGLYWSRVWALYVLIRWCHRQGVFE